jgi:hypothetical protein
MAHTNPFVFGGVALDASFTDREAEVAELAADMRNGQDVVVYAPRRYGKSSLVLRAAQDAIADGALVGYCDLMRTPTKERLAAALARTIYSDLDTVTGQALERARRLFSSLRVTPTIEVDPEDATLRFSFSAGRRREAIDDTIEALLELPATLAAERKRRVVLVFDEFQEIVALDPAFPNLLRAVFQRQRGVSHVYLGSKRHVLDRIFNDRNEPFWRSAKQLEIGVIARPAFADFLEARFAATDKSIDAEAVERLLDATGGHPYATQELAYFVWELVPDGFVAHLSDVEEGIGKALLSEHNHLASLWEDAPQTQRLVMLALMDEPTAAIYSEPYHGRHELPPKSTLQVAVRALVQKEVIRRDADGEYAIVEPFFADWLRRERARP